MDSAVSVSKGVFVFKNGFKSAIKRKGARKKITAVENGNIFSDELWYQSYNDLWRNIEQKILNLNRDMFSSILSHLVDFIRCSYEGLVHEIPCGTLLTGINMPDHAAQFTALATEIRKEISPHVAILSAQDCQTIKLLVEYMIHQFVNVAQDSSDEEDEEVENSGKKIKKSQCNFALLQSWYEDLYGGKKGKVLVLICPDFESFNEHVLQDFIQIASSYINILPFVLVFGVATSLSALHKALPYQVSSKVNIQVFNSQPSTAYLNNVLENVFFSDECPFHLGGKLFTLFTDIFLFYDFSVTGFIQNFKYAMLEHFNGNSAMSLCVPRNKYTKILDKFEHDDFENVRKLMSFRKLVESESFENQIKLLEDDAFFRKVLHSKIEHLHDYMNKLHVLLKCLKVLVSDLPKTPLGKQVRELYNLATTQTLTQTPEFKEAFQLLAFQSKDELTAKIKTICAMLNEASHTNKFYLTIIEPLSKLLDEMEDVTSELCIEEEQHNNVIDSKMDRQQLKEKLLLMSKQSRPLNKYEKAREKLVKELEKIFQNNVPVPSSFAFHEIFFFNDVSIQSNIIGSHRAAIHTALNDPNSYLQCSCCELPNDSTILNTMPDICIAYKLHLEYGKMINLYDWLQAFLTILDPVYADDDDEKKEVSPQLQARFTQSVAELEFLGFIKSSKRKTDHVSRLTWGG